MKEKDKARELVGKNLAIIRFYFNYGTNELELAKQCAIICVDEILDSVPISPHNGEYYETLGDRLEEVETYWNGVKQQIKEI